MSLSPKVSQLTLLQVKVTSPSNAPYPSGPMPIHLFDSQVDIAAAPGLLEVVMSAWFFQRTKVLLIYLPSFDTIDPHASHRTPRKIWTGPGDKISHPIITIA